MLAPLQNWPVEMRNSPEKSVISNHCPFRFILGFHPTPLRSISQKMTAEFWLIFSVTQADLISESREFVHKKLANTPNYMAVKCAKHSRQCYLRRLIIAIIFNVYVLIYSSGSNFNQVNHE